METMELLKKARKQAGMTQNFPNILGFLVEQ